MFLPCKGIYKGVRNLHSAFANINTFLRGKMKKKRSRWTSKMFSCGRFEIPSQPNLCPKAKEDYVSAVFLKAVVAFPVLT